MSQKSYALKLLDPRWQKKRLEILNAANWQCEQCGIGSQSLQVHHSHYIKTLEPWEYSHDLLHCLCEPCHVKRQETEEALKADVMRLLRFFPTERLRIMAWRLVGETLAETQREFEKLEQEAQQ